MYQNQFEEGGQGEGDEYDEEEEEYADEEQEVIENTNGEYESDRDEEEDDDQAQQNYSYQDPVQEVCTEDEQTSGDADEEDMNESHNQMMNFAQQQ